MDAHYQVMYKQAAALQHQFHDYTHTVAHDPMAGVMRHEIHKFTEDLATNRNPRTIEDRLRTIQTQIRNSQLAHPSPTPNVAGSVLNHNQSNYLHTGFEHMRLGIRQHPRF